MKPLLRSLRWFSCRFDLGGFGADSSAVQDCAPQGCQIVWKAKCSQRFTPKFVLSRESFPMVANLLGEAARGLCLHPKMKAILNATVPRFGLRTGRSQGQRETENMCTGLQATTNTQSSHVGTSSGKTISNQTTQRQLGANAEKNMEFM